VENSRCLRPNPWRYAVLANVLILAILGLAVVVSRLSPGGRVVGAGQFVTALTAFWALFAVAFALGYLDQRRSVWQVDATGISIQNTNGRQVAFLTWAEVARIRVLPFGVVIVSARSGHPACWALVAVAAEPSKWLRAFAIEQLGLKQAEPKAVPDRSRE
jgi:hypothetical protein